jgi:MFS transporter, OPA family, sugar phosphate sensor protein UhpC
MEILRRLGAFYRPAAAAALITDEAKARRTWRVMRWRMFAGFFLGYAVLYFCRKNMSVALPAMAHDLHYSNVQLGLIGTTLYVTYGIGKLLNGLLADRANIRRFMATSLLVSGALNLWFGTASSLWVLAFCWGCNGWFQSMGFPPIARGMSLWFGGKGKATRWAFWTCSHQAGTAVIMAMSAWILTWATWRMCFWLPGVLCILSGAGLLLLLRDTPQSCGLGACEHAAQASGDGTADYRADLIKNVLKNPNVWVIGLIDLCVYIVRFGTLDWTSKFLMETRGYTVQDAGWRAGMMPIAGVVGVLVSGVLSDVHRRYRTVNTVSLALLGLCLYGLMVVGPGHPMFDLLLLFGIGFFVEGPQSILGGVGAVDAGGSARVAAASAGLVGILAYVGASLSGVGTGFAIDRFGWGGALWFWIGCAAIGLILCAGFWREKARPESGA